MIDRIVRFVVECLFMVLIGLPFLTIGYFAVWAVNGFKAGTDVWTAIHGGKK